MRARSVLCAPDPRIGIRTRWTFLGRQRGGTRSSTKSHGSRVASWTHDVGIGDGDGLKDVDVTIAWQRKDAAIDQSTGRLTATGDVLQIERPMCVRFVKR